MGVAGRVKIISAVEVAAGGGLVREGDDDERAPELCGAGAECYRCSERPCSVDEVYYPVRVVSENDPTTPSCPNGTILNRCYRRIYHPARREKGLKRGRKKSSW